MSKCVLKSRILPYARVECAKLTAKLAGQLCLFSLLRTLLSRQDLRNILDKSPSLPTISVPPLNRHSALSRDYAHHTRNGLDREAVDGLDPIHIYNKSFEDRYQEKESRERAFLTSSMEEKGRWRAQSDENGSVKAKQFNGNATISPQELTRSIMKDQRARHRNTRANMVDFVNSESEQLVLPRPIQTLPGKLDSNVSGLISTHRPSPYAGFTKPCFHIASFRYHRPPAFYQNMRCR